VKIECIKRAVYPNASASGLQCCGVGAPEWKQFVGNHLLPVNITAIKTEPSSHEVNFAYPLWLKRKSIA
jgi:hypothetical protein